MGEKNRNYLYVLRQMVDHAKMHGWLGFAASLDALAERLPLLEAAQSYCVLVDTLGGMGEPEIGVSARPDVQGGEPCIAGTRMPVRDVVEVARSNGATVVYGPGMYPHLTRGQVLWAIVFWMRHMRSRVRGSWEWPVWERQNRALIDAGRWDDVPDPPTVRGK